MGTVRWERSENFKGIQETIPSSKSPSRKNFRPPPTIESDFRRLLDHDVPYVNYTFELVRDWYERDVGGDPIYLRAQQTPIDWKSKIGNSDMSTNFKVTHDIPIRKGDMVVREDGVIYLLNWEIQNHANNQTTQSTKCNAYFEFTRYEKEVTDSRGFLIEEAGKKVIASAIPGTHTEYAGRPDYMASQGQPGIHPDHLITCTLQWNSTTRNIQINDEFELGMFTYRVINISIAEVDISQEHGVQILNAKRVAGGGQEEKNEQVFW